MSTRWVWAKGLVSAAGLVSIPAPGLGQGCQGRWVAGPDHGMLGTDVGVSGMTLWDPDGPGALTPRLAVASVSAAGTAAARGIALYDESTRRWSSLDALPGVEQVFAMSSGNAGELAASVQVRLSPSSLTRRVDQWNGSAWTTLGPDWFGTPTSVARLPSGEVLATGAFTSVSGVAQNGVWKWDGSTWSRLGSNQGNPAMTRVVVHNGRVFASGSFTQVGGVAARNIAQWDGAAWSPLLSGVGAEFFTPEVRAMVPDAAGRLIIAGRFRSPGFNIAAWNGTGWSGVAGGLDPQAVGGDSSVSGVAIGLDGLIYVGGRFRVDSAGGFNNVAASNGTWWSSFGNTAVNAGTNDSVASVATLPSGDIVAGGSFTRISGTDARNVARWNGVRWSAMSGGVRTTISAAASRSDGTVILGELSGPGPTSIYRWDGQGLAVVGAVSSQSGTGHIRAASVLPNDNIIVAGSFTSVGGVAAPGVARWNGFNWSAVGSGSTNGEVASIATPPGGDLVVSGAFTNIGGAAAARVARWTGSAWSPLGAGLNDSVRSLAVLPGGTLVAGGIFTASGSAPVRGLARWDGVAWSPLGGGVDGSVTAMVVMPSGDLIVAGSFANAGTTPATRIARWDGSSWSALGSGLDGAANALAVMPNGDLIAGGQFGTAGGLPANRVARWDGSAWSPLGSGVADGIAASVLALHVTRHGELIVGGQFTRAGDLAARSWARWSDSGVPWFATQPRPLGAPAAANAVFTAVPADGYTNTLARWQLESAPGSQAFEDLAPGPIPGSKASAAIAPPRQDDDPGPTTLTITSVDAALSNRRVRVIISNGCGPATSDAVPLTVLAPCDANCDGSTTTPVLDALDFICFLGRYLEASALPPAQQAASYANCDGSTTFPQLNALDFSCFLTRFRAGCP